MAPTVEITLLGGFNLRHGVRAIELPAQKDRALLAILALSPGKAHSRVKLATLLWGETGERQSRDNLKQSVLRLRRCFGGVSPATLVTSREIVMLAATDISVDAVQFEDLSRQDATGALENCLALYRGELLEDIAVRSAPFDDWLIGERRRFHRIAVDACLALMARCHGDRQADAAARAARRLLELEPLHEPAFRLLMQYHADRGERAQALQIYDELADALRRELDVAPEPDTQRLCQSIRAAAGPASEQRTLARDPDFFGKTARLAVAVLPFEDLSAPREEAYFGNGIAEDIIAELSRFRSLLVMAKNSTFQYRGPAVDFKRIARELGVHYVVQGSVRRTADRIRVSAQLIDAATGENLGAERFDRDLHDVFAVEDDVSRMIVTRIEGRISAGAAVRARRKPTASMAAYDFVLQARELMARYDLAAAEPLLEKAVTLDPTYAEAHGRRAFVVLFRYWSDQDESHLPVAREHAERALEADESEEWAHFAIANVHLNLRQFEAAEKHFERGIEINPNNVPGRIMHAEWLTFAGRYEDALRQLDDVKLRDPFPPDWYWEIRGSALFQLRRYEEAARCFRSMGVLQPWNRIYLAASLGYAGDPAGAARQLAIQRAEAPGLSLERIAARDPYRDAAATEHLVAGLHLAQRAV